MAGDWKGLEKRLPEEDMVETSLKGLLRIHQMEKCTAKGNCIAKTNIFMTE